MNETDKITFLVNGNPETMEFGILCRIIQNHTRDFFASMATNIARREIEADAKRKPTTDAAAFVAVCKEAAKKDAPAQQTLNLGRAKTQPRLVATFRGKPHQQFLSGVYSAWEKLAASTAFDADGYISARFVSDSHIVADSDATTKERVDAMKMAGVVRETNRHGRPYYRVHRDAARVVDAIKSAKFHTPSQRSVYFERPIPAADV